MTPKEAKQKLRADILADANISGLRKEDSGRAAEQVRKLLCYRKARRIYVDLDASLAQVRLNVLLDGKELIAPAPGLKGGYYVLKSFQIPFHDLSFAVTPRGMERHAERRVAGTLAGSPVNLFLTSALALDPTGMRIGDGKGFFDLSCAIIRAYQPRVRPAVFVVGSEDMVLTEPILSERWDVRATGLVTAQGVRMFMESPAALPPIVWEALDENRIRKADFLWKLFNRKGDGTTGQKPKRFPDTDAGFPDGGDQKSWLRNETEEEDGHTFRRSEEKSEYWNREAPRSKGKGRGRDASPYGGRGARPHAFRLTANKGKRQTTRHSGKQRRKGDGRPE